MEEFYIEFDTQSNPGKLEAIKVGIGLETITEMDRQLNIALPSHPLYSRLYDFVKRNPPRR